MKKFLFTAALLALVVTSNAQNGLGMPLTLGRGGVATTFNTDDEAIGINPANLGYSKFGFSITAFNYGVQAHSEKLSLSQLSRIFLDRKRSFSDQEKEQLSQLFSTDNGLNFLSHTRFVAASVQVPVLGSFAASLEGYSTGHVSLNENAADIIFNGNNADVFESGEYQNKYASELLDGTKISYQQFRTLNIAYGREVFSFGGTGDIDLVKLYIGAGYRYIWGMRHLDVEAKDGNFHALSSFSSDKSIDYGTIRNFSPSNAENLFNSSGRGYALDFGVNAKIGGMVKVGAAIINSGKVTWETNVLAAADTTLNRPAFNDGIENYKFGDQAELFYGENGVFKFENGEKFETKLPTQFRLGIGFQPVPMLQIGADYVVPLNNANPTLDASAYSFAAQVNVGLVKISTGFSINEQFGGGAVPLGFQLNMGIMQLSLATGDVLTLINGEDNPNASFGAAAFRFSL